VKNEEEEKEKKKTRRKEGEPMGIYPYICIWITLSPPLFFLFVPSPVHQEEAVTGIQGR
jgi:hypothetical protein